MKRLLTLIAASFMLLSSQAFAEDTYGYHWKLDLTITGVLPTADSNYDVTTAYKQSGDHGEDSAGWALQQLPDVNGQPHLLEMSDDNPLAITKVGITNTSQGMPEFIYEAAGCPRELSPNELLVVSGTLNITDPTSRPVGDFSCTTVPYNP